MSYNYPKLIERANMNLSKHERSVLVTHVEQELCTGSPSNYPGLESLKDDWFIINAQGNVGINLRNIAYGINYIIAHYAVEYNPSWGVEFQLLTVTNQHRLAYGIYTGAMSRTGVKEYKRFFKRQHSSKILEKHESELKRVKYQLEQSTMRKDYLEAQIALLKK